MRLLCISVNAPYSYARILLSRLGWYYQLLLVNYKNGYAGLLAPHLLPFLKPWLIVEMQLDEVISIGVTLIDIYLNWLNRFYVLILEGGLLVILIDCLILLSLFLDVTLHVYTNSFSPKEYFPLTYGLNGIKSRINRYLLTVGSF